MLFQTQTFLLAFLPLTLGVWYFVPNQALREWALIALSLVFYGWWDPRFVSLLLVQAVVSWLICEAFLRCGRRKAILAVGIAANLAVIGLFKYWLFLGDTIAALTGAVLPRPSILLPIGISFFTFEIISYLADLGWRGAPRYRLRRFLVFVTLFPRLIAGPIVRHNEIIPQLDLDPWRDGLAERLGRGATLLIVGLVKKVFIADALAPHADLAFTATAEAPGLLTAWSGALAFTFQLFLDFSAYSEMAIGIALMLGFMLPQNFDAPYRATSLRDFWRRWHMTLSRFLRDYLYIPLGGSRHGRVRFAFATMATMGLCGLWHGAGWTFVVWGLLHGAGLIAVRGWQALERPLPRLIAWGLTFVFVVAGWVLFRAPDFTTAVSIWAGMAGFGGEIGRFGAPVLIAVAAAVSLVGPTTYQAIVERLKPSPQIAVAAGLAAALVVLKVGSGQPVNFIYFQF